MKKKQNYQVKKLSFLRKMVRASTSITREKNSIHLFAEIDVSRPLELIQLFFEKHQTKLSFTGYLAKAFSKTVQKHPGVNSFIAGNKHVLMDDINISILVERQIGEDFVPEPMVLYETQSVGVPEITKRIRLTQEKARSDRTFGTLSSGKFIRFIPGFLLKSFVRLADRSITMGLKYGKLAITSVGMFSKYPFWIIPHGSATILLSVGGIQEKVVDKQIVKILCLTVSFDHDIIDGSPAARFMNDLIEEIQSGSAIESIC